MFRRIRATRPVTTEPDKVQVRYKKLGEIFIAYEPYAKGVQLVGGLMLVVAYLVSKLKDTELQHKETLLHLKDLEVKLAEEQARNADRMLAFGYGSEWESLQNKTKDRAKERQEAQPSVSNAAACSIM